MDAKSASIISKCTLYCEYEAGQEVRFTGLRNKMGLYSPLCRMKRKSHVKRLAKFSLNRSKEINFLARSTYFLLRERLTSLTSLHKTVYRHPRTRGRRCPASSQREESELNSSGKLYDPADKAQLTSLNEWTRAER